MSSFLSQVLISSQLFGIILGLCVALTVRKVLKTIPDQDIYSWVKTQFIQYKDVIIAGGVGFGIGMLTGF